MDFVIAVWTFALFYVAVCIVKPLPPFRTRKQVVFLGVPFLLLALVLVPVFLSIGTVSNLSVAQNINVESKPNSLPIRAITQVRDNGMQVVFRKPKITRLSKGDVGKGVWSLKQDHLDIICFADGNNAIIVHVGNEYYAANGTAKQFIDYDKNEGLVSTDNKLIQLHPWPGGAHLDLHTPVIDAGFKLCPRKSMDEKVAATVAGMTRNAADTPKAETPAKSPTIIVVKKPKAAPFTKAQDAAARVLVEAEYGGAHCNYPTNIDVLNAEVEKQGITSAHWKVHGDRLYDLAEKKLGTDDKINCRLFYRKFGPGGLNLVFKPRGK